MNAPRTYCFGEFVLNGATRRLRRGEQELPLEPKSFRLLEHLIEHRDRVLGKDEIFRAVWEDTVVTDNALTRAVAQIRKALDDDPKRPRFIETLPTIGYRFIGEVDAQQPLKPTVAHVNTSRRRSVWVLLTVALLLAGLAGWRLWPKTPTEAVPASTPIPLTAFSGNVVAPSFSPEGSQVAFQWDGEKQDNADIYVQAIGPDATPLRLTTNPLPDRMPSWSPDGATIAFLRVLSPGQADLMLIPALGGPERRLAHIPIWDDPVWDTMGSVPAWSPDGQWLIVPELVRQQTALFRISLQTGEQVQITTPDLEVDDKFPAFSPDGKTLLFNRRPTFYLYGSLYAVRLDAEAKPLEAPHRIASHDLLIAGAAWLGNGTEVVARTQRGLYRLPIDGRSEPQPVPGTGGAEVQGVAASRHGDRVAYSVVHGDTNIWRLDLHAKRPTPEPFIASTFRDVAPRYSPDGRQIAFQSMRGDGKSQIWLCDSSGKQPHQLTFVKHGVAGVPRWSPDGRRLSFDSNTTGSYQIYTMDADGTHQKQLTSGRFDNFSGIWSRNGQSLYFTSTRTGRTEIWKMPAEGGAATQVTSNGAEFGTESEDGKSLYFTRILRGDSGAIWNMPLPSGEEKQLADSLYRMNYVVTPRAIYYMTHADRAGNSQLKRYDLATRLTSTLLQIGRPEMGLEISPDGRYLLYAQFDNPASGLMLIDNVR